MSKHRITKKTTKRILASAMSLVLLLSTIPSLTMNANEAGGAQRDRAADGSTIDSYTDFLNIADSTLNAGRVWTDKSVYALDGSDGTYSVDVDDTPLTYNVTSEDDFLEVFSALGSSAVVNGEEDVPLDVMFVLDISGSMGELVEGSADESDDKHDYEKTRLAYAVEALNSAFDYVQNQNEYNRVGLCIYSGNSIDWNNILGQDGTDAGNGLLVLELGRYTDKKTNDDEYFSVGGYGNLLYSKNETGTSGQVYMSVNINGTKIDDRTVQDSRANLYFENGELNGKLKDEYSDVEYTTGYALKDKIRAVGATHTQMGLYTAMAEMAKEQDTTVTIKGKTVTRQPVVILLTDGLPTISDGEENWWAPDDDIDGIQGPGGTFYYGNSMLAMATASYMKREINKHYFPDGDDSALIFTFGIDLEGEEANFAEAFLNPKDNFYSDTNEAATDIRETWGKYQNGGTVQIQVNKTGEFVYDESVTAAGFTNSDGDNYIQSDTQLYYSSGDKAEKTVKPGEEITYEFAWSAANDYKGDQTGSNFIITCELDPSVEFVESANENDDKYNVQYDEATRTVTWRFWTDPLESGAVFVTVKVTGEALESNKVAQEFSIYSDVDSYEGGYHLIYQGSEDIVLVAEGLKAGEEYPYYIGWSSTKVGGEDIDSTYIITNKLDSNVKLVRTEPEGVYDEETHTVTWKIDAKANTGGTIYVLLEATDDLDSLKDEFYIYTDVKSDYRVSDVTYKFEPYSEDYYLLYQSNGNILIANEGVAHGETFTDYIGYGDALDIQGNLTEANLRITYKLDPGVEFASADNGGTYDQDTRTVTWDIHTNGEGGVVSVTVKVPEDAKGYLESYKKEFSIYSNVGLYEENYHCIWAEVREKGVYEEDNYYTITGTAGEHYYNVRPIHGVNGTLSSDEDIYTFTRPTGNVEDITTLIYNDEYRPVSSADLSTMLQQVLAGIHNTITVPIEGYNDLTDGGSMLSYYDPIGDYMEVKDVLQLRLFNKVYDIKYENGGYHVVDNDSNGAAIPNPSYEYYGEDIDVTFNLSDIAIEVVSETVNGLRHDVLRVDIPVSALPVWTVECDITRSNNESTVNEYTAHTDVLPLRLFYTVGMQEDYLKQDGSIDLSKISAEYKELHRNLETGRVYFYSNDYSSDPYIYNGGKLSERGDAYTTFSPADSNRFYIYQDYLPLYYYGESNEKIYVTDYNDNQGTYYFDYQYYTSKLKVQTVQIERTGAMFGSGVPGDSSYGDFLVWYNRENQEVADFAPSKPTTNGDWVVATKVGGIRVGDMGDLSDDTQKDDNTTGTSGTYYLPTVSGNTVTKNVIITNYLGNNGERSVGDVTMLLTKQVESDKEDFEDEEFDFTVNIPGMANENLKAIKYKLYNDGSSEYWLRVAETEVEVANGYLVETDGTVTDKKVTDRNVTVSGDGKTGTVTTTNNEKIVVYEVTLDENGVAAYTYHYKINLQPEIEDISFDEGGTANVTLKHGEGLQFDGLNNEEISVTETLTEDQLKDSYRFKIVLDESGSLMAVQPDDENGSRSYTVEKELKSTNSADNFARNEIHWFNKTVKFGKDETHINGEDVETVPGEDGKLHGPAVTVGDKITYEISWANDAMKPVSGTDPEVKIPVSANITITDRLDDGVKFVSADNEGKYDTDTHTVTWTIKDAAVGESGTVHLTVEVTDKARENNKVENKAHIAVENGSDVDTEVVENPVEVPVIEIEKTQSVNGGAQTKEKQTVEAGDEVTYYITITNTGAATAKDVVVTDEIPDGLKLKEINNGGTQQGDVIVWNIGEIEAKGVVTVSFTVTVPVVDEYTVWPNIAAASFENDPENPPEDPNDPTDPDDPHKGRKQKPSNEVEIEEEPEPGTPKLSIEKTQSVNGGAQTKEKQTVEAGDEVTYYITITNTGTATAKDVVVTDEIPDGLKLKEINNGGTQHGDLIVWEIGELEAEDIVTVSFTVTVPVVDKDTTWKNIATVSFENDPENPDNPTDPDPDDPHKGRKQKPSNEVEIEEGVPKLSIEKTQSVNGGAQTNEKQTVEAGDEVTYYITITNTGTATAKDVVVTDEIPDGLKLKEINNGGTQHGDLIVWEIGELEAEGVVTVSFTVTVPVVDKDTEWKNIATVSFENDPENPDNPTDPDLDDPHKGRRQKPSNEVEIEEGVPKLSIEKTQSVNGGTQTKEKQTVEAGDEVTYYIKITNTGTATAKDVVVTDEIPDGLKLKGINNGGTQHGDVIAWNIGEIEAKDVVTVSFTVTVPVVDKDTAWKNIATVSFENDPENPDNPTDPDDPHKGRKQKPSNEVEIEEGVPKLSIEKTQSVNGGTQTKEKQTVEAGDEVTYYITITNTGTATAKDVVVTDEIPDGLKLNTIGNSGTRLVDGKTIVWKIGELEVGDVVTVSFTVTVPVVDKDTTWKNIATVSFENDPENPADPDSDDPHKGRKQKPSNEVEIEEEPAPEPTPEPPVTEPEPEPEPPSEIYPPVTSDNNFNLDDDGIPRGDENLPTDDDNFNLDDDGNPRGDMNIPTGVTVGGSVCIAVGALLLSAAALAVKKRRYSKKGK